MNSSSPPLNLLYAKFSTSQLMAVALDQILRIISLIPYVIESISTSHWLYVLNVSKSLPLITTSTPVTCSMTPSSLTMNIARTFLLVSLPLLLPLFILFSNQHPEYQFSQISPLPKPFHVLDMILTSNDLSSWVSASHVFSRCFLKYTCSARLTLTTPENCKPSSTPYPLSEFIFLPSIYHYIKHHLF